MQWIVDHFYLFILALGTAHLCLLTGLWVARRRRARDLSFYLFNLVKHFSTSPDQHPGGTVHEQIDSFIADIREVIHDKERSGDRGKLYYRLMVKDESKRDIQGTKLETYYNVARTGIEAYPLLGILGTIFAIALGLNTPRHSIAVAPAPPATQSLVNGDSAGTVSADAPTDDDLPAATSGAIIRNFANSIWSTASGIGFAIILMVANAFIEPGFDRLVTHRRNVREAIASAKITLGLGQSSRAEEARPRRSTPGERREQSEEEVPS
jgi:hypothetical protein